MKTAIVTGASGNLGQAVVKKFLLADYFVTGTVVPNDPVEMGNHGKNFETAIVDLMQEESAEQFLNKYLAKHDTIGVAVLTVGGFAMGDIGSTKTIDITKQVQLNFETAYNISRPIFKQMMKQGTGRIFLIGSRPGSSMKSSKGMVAYGLAKSLVFRLAELMNDESKGTDVVTCVIVPSTIDTPQNRKSMPEADYMKWVTPEAIAEVIYFHASPEGSILREPVIKVYGKS